MYKGSLSVKHVQLVSIVNSIMNLGVIAGPAEDAKPGL